ncbi:cation transporter dimerization domain-containing protein, partial [Desulforamulus aquiferis]
GLRTRKSGQYRHVDLHLVVARHLPVGEAHSLCDKIEAEIEGKLPRVHMLIHCEPCEAVEEPGEAICHGSSCGMNGKGCPEGRCPISDGNKENRP